MQPVSIGGNVPPLLSMGVNMQPEKCIWRDDMQAENEQQVVAEVEAPAAEEPHVENETQDGGNEPEWLHRRLKAERKRLQKEMQSQLEQRLASLEQKYQPQTQAADTADLNPRSLIRSELQQIAAEEAQKRYQQEAHERVMSFQQQVEKGSDKFADFEDVVRDPSLPVTEFMAQTAMTSPRGAELLYQLGKHQRDELRRIASLPPHQQVREMILAEAKLDAPKKVSSSAPAPMGTPATTPLAAGGKKTPSQIAREKREQYYARTKSR